MDKKNRKKTAKRFPFLAEVYIHSLYMVEKKLYRVENERRKANAGMDQVKKMPRKLNWFSESLERRIDKNTCQSHSGERRF